MFSSNEPGPWMLTRVRLLPQAGEEGASVAPQAAVRKEPEKKRMPRVDWAKLLRRTFALDVFTCDGCGGRRRVLAYLTAPNAVRPILEHLSLPTRPACAGCGAGATPARVVLSLEQSRCQRRPRPCCLPLGRPLGRRVPHGAAPRLHRPGAQPSWHPSAALLDPSAPALSLNTAPIPPIRPMASG